MEGGILLGNSLFGAGLGAWVSGLVGMSVGNRRIKEFEGAIEEGKLLVLVDVPADRVAETEEGHVKSSSDEQKIFSDDSDEEPLSPEEGPYNPADQPSGAPTK